MPAWNDRFSRVASVWVLLDRGSCVVCGGRLSAITRQSGRRNSKDLDEDADVSTESWEVQVTFLGCYFVSSYCLRLTTTYIALTFDAHILGYESHANATNQIFLRYVIHVPALIIL
jgi:hypothetical protein